MFDSFDAERPGPALTEDDIARFEQRRNRRIPPFYRAYLLWRNGGTPFRQGWPTYAATCVQLQWPPSASGGDPWTNVSYIYRIQQNSEHYNDLDEIFEAKESFGGIPDSILPVARNAGGNLFFMDLSEGTEPRVLYGPYEEPDKAAVVAETFMDFLNALKTEDEV